MIEILMSIGLATFGILAGWLDCVRNGKLTVVGWLMIACIGLLTATAAWYSFTSEEENRAQIIELQETLDAQENQNKELRRRVATIESIAIDIHLLLQPGGTSFASVGSSNSEDLAETMSANNNSNEEPLPDYALESGVYVLSNADIPLFMPMGRTDTLAPPNRQLTLSAGATFQIKQVRIGRRGWEYLVSVPMAKTNSDLDGLGWQNRTIRLGDLDHDEVSASSSIAYEEDGRGL